jgi:heme-degrading monooxygenase HmoA
MTEPTAPPERTAPPVGSVVRLWHGWVETVHRTEYIEYMDRAGMAGYRETPGNLGAYIMSRDHEDGRSTIVTVSYWESFDAIRAFAGDEIDRARFEPEEEQYLVDREWIVTHFTVGA